MFEKYEAMKKALAQGWTPEYEGSAIGHDDKKDETIAVKILSDSTHRCIIFHTFPNTDAGTKEWYAYNNTLYFGQRKLSEYDKAILKILQKYADNNIRK